MSDKFAHAFVCFVSTIVVGMIMGLVSVTASLCSGSFLAIGLGFGKELGDHFDNDNKWDWMDILADLVGMGWGMVLLITYWIIRGKL